VLVLFFWFCFFIANAHYFIFIFVRNVCCLKSKRKLLLFSQRKGGDGVYRSGRGSRGSRGWLRLVEAPKVRVRVLWVEMAEKKKKKKKEDCGGSGWYLDDLLLGVFVM
jgi:hypothetical protein